MIYTDNLYHEILINPIKDGFTDLKIVSGYASAPMVTNHFEELKSSNLDIDNLELIVGMTPNSGLNISDYQGFKDSKKAYAGKFECKYITASQPVHSKLYIWSGKNNKKRAFLGSANYTQNAFIRMGNQELMGDCDPDKAIDYYNSLEKNTIFCDHPDVENCFMIYSRKEMIDNIETNNGTKRNDNNELVTISFLDKNGNLPQKSGLNWGQRKDREKNQAYIRIPSNVRKSNFFPPRGEAFSIITDDDKTLLCARAQDNGKAIHTPSNNSLIGEYFRNRLGLANGQLILKEDLLDYGRTDVEFTKIDDETFYMNFNPFEQKPSIII